MSQKRFSAQNGDIRLFNQDCLAGMKSLARTQPASVDLLLTSPPYGVGKSYEKKVGEHQTQLWKTVWLVYRMMYFGSKLVRPGGYLFVNFGDNGWGRQIMQTETLTTVPMSVWYWQIGRKLGLELQATRIWRKPFARLNKPFYLNHHPRPVFDYEHLWTWRVPDGTGKEIVNEHKIGRRGVWDTSTILNEMPLKNHEAAFPVVLPEWAITVYSQPGSLILDPFAGSCSTAIACINLGRKFLGYEILENNFNCSVSRIKDVLKKPRMKFEYTI